MKGDCNFVVRSREKWRGLFVGEAPDIGAVADRIVSNEDIWIVLTYLQLKSRGYAASISDQPLPDRINIIDGIGWHTTLPPPDTYCVGCRGDGHYPASCRVVIQQNLLRHADQPAIYVPQWAQPAIVPRQSDRARIQTVGFLGHAGINLAPSFRTRAFIRALRFRGCRLIVRGKRGDEARWRDYSDLDLVLAIRDIPRPHLRLKPVNKLTNAWIAGVPALIGPEPAVQAIQSSSLDYICVRDSQDVLRAIERFIDEPALYGSMIEHGKRRAAAYNDDAIVTRWLEALRQIREDYEVWRARSLIRRWMDHRRRGAKLRSHMKRHARQVHREYERLGHGATWWAVDDAP